MECIKLCQHSCPHLNEMVKNIALESAVEGNWETMVREATEEQEIFCPSCEAFEPVPEF